MGKDKKEKISKKHKKSRKPSTSDSSASSDEWIEKETSEDSVPSRPVETKSAPVEREDDWGSVFSGMSTVDIRKAKEAEKAKEKVSMEVKPGQSIRELNPYWKDGGSGLPPERDVGKNLVSSFRKPNEDDRGYSGGRFSRTDDDGRSSESKSRRTGEGGHQNDHQSSRSNRYEETDMASNRSGRFKRPNDRDGYGKNHQSSRNGQFRRPDDDGYRRNHQASRNDQFRRPGNEERSSKSKFRRPDDDEYCKDHQSLRSGQFRPDYDGERFKKPDDDRASSSRSTDKGEESSKSRRGWRKSDSSVNASTSAPILPKRDSCSPVRVEIVRKSPSPPSQSKILTSDEINELNAKIFRAEISGKTDLVAKLKKELKNSRREETEKTVILTQTDSKGYTRPVKREERAQGSKNKKKVQTHENSKRVRYFADDDDYSLQDMYEKEKYSSARDQEEDFMNLMGKEMARKDGSLALDDPFEETASIDNRNKKEKQQWDRAVRDQAKKEKIYDECKWCLGAKRMNEKLVIKTKQKVYLSCPPFQSLTEGHCLIIPHSHISCSLQADEDVWDEVMELRKELVRKLERNDEDCVFFETASYLHKHPHMILHCVPLPREIGDMAPIYFKKALLDCESEWTDNKKVVDLAGRGVRKAVPKGLPYFFVDFGDQAGYAHVIEDLKLFPNNFAQEIIGGMLDLNHELWRKQRNVSDKELEKNVKYLKQLMEETNNCD